MTTLLTLLYHYHMKKRGYLLVAFLVFVATVTGSDIYARMTIAGESFRYAFSEHMRWVSLTNIGLLFFFGPFGGVALISSYANGRAKARGIIAIFILAMLCLGYFYFDGFQAAQQAMIMKRWTAAGLSVGLLPFFIGIPLLLVVAGLSATIAWLDPQKTSTADTV